MWLGLHGLSEGNGPIVRDKNLLLAMMARRLTQIDTNYSYCTRNNVIEFADYWQCMCFFCAARREAKGRSMAR